MIPDMFATPGFKSAFGVARVGLEVCGQLYVYDSAAHPLENALQRFDPGSNDWTRLPSMQQRRIGSCPIEMEGALYMCGGSSLPLGHPTRNAERFVPSLNVWEELPQMISRRRSSATVAKLGQLYLCGGNDGVDRLRTVERFDSHTNTWTAVPSMLRPRSNSVAALVGDKIYVCGGCEFAIGNADENETSVECFDLEAVTWKRVAPLPASHIHGSIAVECCGELCVIFRGLGDIGDADATMRIYRFDPDIGTWAAPMMFEDRQGAAMAVSAAVDTPNAICVG